MVLPVTPSSGIELGALVASVAQGDGRATEQLFELLAPGLRWLAMHHLRCAEDAEDITQSVMVIVLSAIRDGTVQHPEALPGFARTILKRQIVATIGERMKRRQMVSETNNSDYYNQLKSPSNPEQSAYRQERVCIARTALQQMSGHEREVLTRFYVQEQTAEEIQCAMDLTPTQFRLLKSRAKAKFGRTGRMAMKRSVLRPVLLAS